MSISNQVCILILSAALAYLFICQGRILRAMKANNKFIANKIIDINTRLLNKRDK